MTQLLSANNTNLATLSPSSSAGSVFCMTVDQLHSHENSSAQSVSTLSTFIDEITLQHKLKHKHKPINKLKKKNIAHWTRSDINALIELLRKYGSDFTMIATQMDKTRDQIKRKFKVLEKKNPQLAEAIFQREISNETLKAISSEMEVQENDFFTE